MNPLLALKEHGQSVWLDFLDRKLLTGGGLTKLIREDGLAGMTSNPSIFEKAIGSSADYDASFRNHAESRHLDVGGIFESLAVEDIRTASDRLMPVYTETGGHDGFISLEVSPYLADDTDGTIAEAQRLWKEVDRPNLMIKVPGTEAGVPAVRQLVSEGLNINITLLFARSAYEAVAEAYLDGLEAFASKGGNLAKVASVASFFVSRIDTAIDKEIESRLKTAQGADAQSLKALQGKVAIANAKLAYRYYQRLIASDRWRRLADKGATRQRLLWASTGTKNPAYSDVLYVDELIGPDTINTMPLATLDAFRDHGRVRETLVEGVDEAERILGEADRLGLDLDGVTKKLVVDGVRLFADSADKLLATVERKRQALLGPRLNRTSASLCEHGDAVAAAGEDWRRSGNVRRLWARDASLWTGADEAKWLAWIDAVGVQLGQIKDLEDFQADIRSAGFTHALLIGMGGSSLGPEVFAETFGSKPGYPKLHVLDSTDPAQVKTFEGKLDIARTLFIVASKSGSTLEPNILKQYFFERAKDVVGADRVGQHFVAITDPGSQMEQVARQDRFRRIFFGNPNIGGRYSVMSNFGAVPAAAIGLDMRAFFETTAEMVRACGSSVPPDANPGVSLGCILGALGVEGCDKVTVVASPGIADFGAWLEQLVAESTGKLGKGLIPVDAEPLGDPNLYGDDRVFAYLRLDGEADPAQDAAIEALEGAGKPVVRIALADRALLGQEFFRWEIATAVAGAILGINPFDQPDVEASKVKTRALTSAYEQSGALPAETPLLEDQGVKLYADAANADALARLVPSESFDAYIAAHLTRLTAGDYCALLAYIEHNKAHTAALTAIRAAIRDQKRVATCVGFGPRFLHSTGQAYKGGPNSGVFLQITCDHAEDLPVPGQKYSFGVVEAAQARGDFDVLAERGRRALRVHLGADVKAGLERLSNAIEKALA